MAVKVLIVDDSAAIRDILRLDLESIGCEIVAEAGSAAQALSLFHTVDPDVVTLDVLMPRAGGLDSLALFRILRRQAPSVAIIIVSVVSDPELRAQFMDGGAMEYIVKPFNRRIFDRIRQRLQEQFPALKTASALESPVPQGIASPAHL